MTDQSSADIIFYSTPDGTVKVDVRFEDETFWLSQKRVSELFGVETPTINYHLKEVFATAELDEGATIRKFRIVQTEGNWQVTRDVEYYNLDAIISVGYRVNSSQAKVSIAVSTTYLGYSKLRLSPEEPR